MRAEGAFLFSKKLRAELLPNFEDHERSRILAAWGESGHELGELNWAHGLACPSEDLIYIADMNNWRVQKLVTKEKK
jgi:hypothetical protein